jgi:SAM-dependent methyltransferase
MGLISPGGAGLMAGAIEEFGLAPGSRALDLCCGEGDALARLADAYGFRCTGVDKSEELIRRGRAKRPELDLHACAAESLNSLALGEFDAVVIECSLSVSGAPDLILYEAVNALAPGGYLLIADLCDREEAKRCASQAPADLSMECRAAALPAMTEEAPPAPSDVVLVRDGRISVSGLLSVLRGRNLPLVKFEDRSRDLDSFAAEKIFAYGSLEAYYASAAPEGSARCGFFPCTANAAGAPGYFLAVFRQRIIAAKRPSEI